VLGEGERHFLIKQIDRRPDFDVIIALNHAKTRRVIPDTIMLPVDSMLTPDLEKLSTLLHSKLPVPLSKIQTIYFETEDLNNTGQLVASEKMLT